MVRIMSRVKDNTPKNSAGRSPTFQIRITPELREQLDKEALKDGVSLATWLKGIARDERRRRGISPKG